MLVQQLDCKTTHIMNSMKLVILLYFISWKKTPMMLWHHNAKVNSHQRWKPTRNRVCFHLWCELTCTMDVTEWQATWNSCLPCGILEKVPKMLRIPMHSLLEQAALKTTFILVTIGRPSGFSSSRLGFFLLKDNICDRIEKWFENCLSTAQRNVFRWQVLWKFQS